MCKKFTAGYISTQYHIVVDDLFQQFFGIGEHEVVNDDICNHFFEKRYFSANKYFGQNDRLVYSLPPLGGIWFDETGCCYLKDKQKHQQKINEEREC